MARSGTTQSALARMSGVRQPSISQFLSGRTAMSDEMLDRLLACMGYRLEVIRHPIQVDLDRNHHRSWELHRQLATHLDPAHLDEWIPTITRNLERLRSSTQGEPHTRNIERWSQLIEARDLAAIRHILTGLDIDSVQMREVSPLGGLLSANERARVLASLARTP